MYYLQNGDAVFCAGVVAFQTKAARNHYTPACQAPHHIVPCSPKYTIIQQTSTSILASRVTLQTYRTPPIRSARRTMSASLFRRHKDTCSTLLSIVPPPLSTTVFRSLGRDNKRNQSRTNGERIVRYSASTPVPGDLSLTFPSVVICEQPNTNHE